MDTVSRKALIDFCDRRYAMNDGSTDVEVGWRQAMSFIIQQLKSGAFPSTESEGEASRLREALNSIMNGNWTITRDSEGLAVWSTNRIDPFTIAQEALSSHTEDVCKHQPEYTGGNIYYRCKLCGTNMADIPGITDGGGKDFPFEGDDGPYADKYGTPGYPPRVPKVRERKL